MRRISHGVRFENTKKPSLEKPITVFGGQIKNQGHGVFKLPEKKLLPSSIMSAIKRAGIIDEIDGMPLYGKLSSLQKEKDAVLTVCCFDDDPYTSSSEAAFMESPKKVFAGLAYAAKACGVKAMEAAVRDRVTFVKKNFDKIKIIKCPDRYPAIAIMKRDFERRGRKFSAIGAQACTAVYDAVKNKKPQGYTVVTVAGDGAPKWFNCRVKIGTPVKAILDGSFENYGEAVVTGSSMTGHVAVDLSEQVKADTRLVLVLQKNKIKRVFPCIGCGKCVNACMQGIVPWSVLKEMESGKIDFLRLPNVQRCIGCAACNAVCPSGIDLLSAVKRAAEIKESGDIYAAV